MSSHNKPVSWANDCCSLEESDKAGKADILSPSLCMSFFVNYQVLDFLEGMDYFHNT